MKSLGVESELLKVQKPGRYTGGELGIIRKDNASVRMAISYPDLYEVGMSNNGIRILYDAVNSIEFASCERVFSVEDDFEQILRKHNQPLYTLETYTPLNELDIIGFNLSHELLYTNMLQILDLGRIEIFRSARNENSPIVIAGGESASNPLPVVDFIDAFVIGDGEEALPDIVKSIYDAKKKGLTREERIRRLADIEGVFVPSVYDFVYDSDNRLAVKGPAVKKRVFSGEPKEPLRPIVPNIRISHERVVAEVSRGCHNFCKFCHAGFYDLPYRVQKHEDVKKRIFEMIKNTGYNEVSLASLSVSDYPFLYELVAALLPELNEMGVSISLPSLKVDPHTLPVLEVISDIRRGSLTFAVESASTRIRELANKKVYEDELIAIIEDLFRKGLNTIKFYFMIGLPGCENVDEASEIVALLKKINAAAKSKKNINVTVSPFVPKPHTPFQRERQMDVEYFRETLGNIKRNALRNMSIKGHDVRGSTLEGVFSRGDSRLGRVIYGSYIDGCRLDSWGEHFKYDIWVKNLDANIPDWKKYLERIDESARLPWEFITSGADAAIDAMKERCLDLSPREKKQPDKIFMPERSVLDESMKRFALKYEVKKRIRVRFSKTGTARFIPHLDFVEVVRRAFRIAGVPVSFSQGFNKHERISFGFPLPLGLESISELCDADLYADISGGKAEIITAALPDGISCVEIKENFDTRSLMASILFSEYRVESTAANIEKLASAALEKPSILKESKSGKELLVPFDEAVTACEQSDGSLKLRLTMGAPTSVRIDAIVSELCRISGLDAGSVRILKTGQFERTGASL